jgi:DNA-binding MarR family transcriptional regulator
MEGRDAERGTSAEPAVSWLHLVERVATCSRLLRAELDARMEACALNPSQFSLLWACHQECAGVGQRELAELLAVSPAHVSGLVEQLRRRRLLAGHRPATDRRRQLWRLTAQGRETVDAVLTALRNWAGELERRLPADASRTLERLVDELSLAVACVATSAPAPSQKGAA